MSSSKFVPPKFIDDASEYAEYKKKLLRWARITKTDPKQKAEVVLYHLEGHPSGIQIKIDTALGDEIVDKEDGMDKLVVYLDSIYKEDEMTNMWTKYKKFVRLKKGDEQPVNEFIAEFETAYKEAKDNGCEVSDTVLALNLLESCCLSETDEKFVLTAVDFKKGKENGDCLDQVKKSLRKFQSRDRMLSEKERDRLQFKEEDTFIADVKDALLADGWRPPAGQLASNLRKNSSIYQGQKNKLGPDGKPLRCFECNSEYHFSTDCDKKNAKKNAEKKPSSSKSSSRSKKKTEQTMLSTMLAKSKFSMVCEVLPDCNVHDSYYEKPMVLSDLFSLSGVHSSRVCESDDVEEEPVMLSDLFSSLDTQCSFVCEVDHNEHDDVGEVDVPPVTLHDLLLLNHSTASVAPITESDNGEDYAVQHTTLHDLLTDSIMAAENDKIINNKIINDKTISDDSCIKDNLQQLDHVEPTSEGNLVLVSHDEEKLCYLVEEAGCRGVLDSGCSKSVAGIGWVESYTNAISPDYSKQIKLSPSSEVYMFGGGEKRKSKGNISLPTLIGDNRVFISMDVVDASIPLLIGTNSMKAGKAILNFDSNEAIFFDEVVPMMEVGSGHFCIGLVSENLLTYIDDVTERDKKVQDVLVVTESVKVSDLKKYHHYYGHTHPDKLLKFLKKAGKDTEGLRAALVKIENSCESCNRSKRRKPRPQCAIPRVDGPDQILTVDLKEWKGKGNKRYICYLIDMFSRLTSGSFIENKNPDTIVNCILEHWISKFGIFKALHSDIGGEFSNSVVEDIASKLGVELTTTASYSPHQNGVNERNHAVIDLMVIRMLESDKNLSPNTALLWAFNAKNSLENHLGFSSFQLHIGKNPLLLSATRDGPSSFDNTSLSKNYVKHVNAMMSAREQFIKAESSFSLKKALKGKIHARGHDIQEGDTIYYKKSEGKGKNIIWKGPSKVTAINGKKLFIDQGARLSTVNRDDAVRVGEEFWRMDELPKHRAVRDVQKKKTGKKESKKNDTEKMQLRRKGEKKSKSLTFKIPERQVLSSSSSESEEELNDEIEGEILEVDDEGELAGEVHGNVVEVHHESDEVTEEEDAVEVAAAEGFRQCLDSTSDHEMTSQEDTSEAEEEDEEEELEEEQEEEEEEGSSTLTEVGHQNSETEYEDAETNILDEIPVSSSSVQTVKSISCHNVEKDNVISYRIPETDTEEISRVLSRAGKASGPNKFWWNVEVQGSLQRKSVDTEAVADLKKVNALCAQVTPTLVVSIPRYLHNEPQCLSAKEKELKNWRDFGVYCEVEDIGQKTINTNWVLIRKDTGIKARLCIRGDQEPDKHNIPTDSPTVNKVNIKLFYLLAASLRWTIQTADVKSAFLQGSELDRDIFVRPPKEVRVPGMLWKMVKRAYGFVDASRGFFLELEKTLLNLGCEVSRYDPAMYIYFTGKNRSLSGMLLTHVDDFLHGSGDKEFHEKVMFPLKQRFKFSSEEDKDFLYVGMHVVQTENDITVDQDRYVDELETPDIKGYSGIGDLDTVLDDDGQADYRAVVGRIGWVANSTRPDLSYDNIVLSMKLGKATIRDMRQACKIITKIKCDGTQMKFVNLGPVTQWTLHGFGDAGFKSLPDKTSSCGGHVILVCNREKGLSCVLDWKTKKLKRVVSSSTAAEALAANDTLDMLVYVHSVLVELLGKVGKNIPLLLATDSKNLHKCVMNSSLVENPRLRTDIAMLKESLKSRELGEFVHVAGRMMIADVLTKKGAAGFKLMSLLHTCEL